MVEFIISNPLENIMESNNVYLLLSHKSSQLPMS